MRAKIGHEESRNDERLGRAAGRGQQGMGEGVTGEVRVLLVLNGAEESHIPVSVSRTTLGLHGKEGYKTVLRASAWHLAGSAH